MDPTYQKLYKQVDNLHYKVKDAIDQPDHPAARTLHDQLRYLMDDFELTKSPRTIEERVKQIMQTLEPARNGSQAFMSISDAVNFHDDFEDLRRDLRDHPDYS
jgi:hypothetical protein